MACNVEVTFPAATGGVFFDFAKVALPDAVKGAFPAAAARAFDPAPALVFASVTLVFVIAATNTVCPKELDMPV